MNENERVNKVESENVKIKRENEILKSDNQSKHLKIV